MPGRTVRLKYNEPVELALPSGERVSVVLRYPRQRARSPELEVEFPSARGVYCCGDSPFDEGLPVPAVKRIRAVVSRATRVARRGVFAREGVAGRRV